MSRELRTRARARIQPDTGDESDESEDADGPAQIPSTSIQDLINPADAGQFDQTFSDADANLNIEGAFDPVAGDKQVIPRIAYVLNFNLVYNEAQERWEPDTGNESGGGALQSTTLEKTSNQSLSTGGSVQTITFQQAGVNSLDAADVSNNQITVPDNGEYFLTTTIKYAEQDDGADLDAQIEANGSTVVRNDFRAPQSSGAGGLTQSFAKVVPLTAGDSITVTTAAQLTANAILIGNPPTTHLSVTQLS